jgi:hypothetical protein
VLLLLLLLLLPARFYDAGDVVVTAPKQLHHGCSSLKNS